MKKIMAALGLASGLAQAQIGIDVVIRDFPVTHPDFENFSEEKDNIPEDVYPGFNGEWKQYGRTCATSNGVGDAQTDFIPDYLAEFSGAVKICQDGRPCEVNPFLPEGLNVSSVPDQPVRYGEFINCKTGNKTQRGLVNELEGNCNPSWSNQVFVTPGMVKPTLVVPTTLPSNAAPGTTVDHYAYPEKNNDKEGCDARHFDQWFRKSDESKELVTQLVLDPVEGEDGVYEVNWNWNNGGYFPLDSMDGTYGKQSLSIMCPPYDYKWANSQKDKDDSSTFDLCNDWKEAGGPRVPGAAADAADKNGDLGAKHLHNYGFTMAGYATFKYAKGKGEVFEFMGDDDMWIYVDGRLVVDLGGTHLGAPGKLNMDEVAAALEAEGAQPWADRSVHKVHFFYADRQTDGSNMRLKMTLSDVIEGVFGAPRVTKVETEKNEKGEVYTYLYVNTKLDESSIQAFVDNSALGYPLVVHKTSGAYMGYQIKTIEFVPTTDVSAGLVYKITGSVCDENGACDGKLSSGDSLSFNVPMNMDDTTASVFRLEKNSDSKIRSSTKAAAVQLKWARNNTSLANLPFEMEVVESNVVKPDFAVDQMFTSATTTLTVSDGAKAADGVTPASTTPANAAVLAAAGVSQTPAATVVHGFGPASNSELPPSKTGELILTTYPSSTNDDWANVSKTFGLAPSASAGIYGLVDPTVANPEGGVSFVKNGFEGESNVDGSFRVSPTRCTSNGTNVNCLNFSLDAQQPFRINVTVYDHLGHFITKYTQDITEKEFRNVTQTSRYVTGEKLEGTNACSESAALGTAEGLTNNGYIRVNVNLYPFSQTGRRLGNGVYILKVDREDLPYTGCYNISGYNEQSTKLYVRYHDESKLGWMRSK